MPIPASYTEESLKSYMLTVLKDLGAVLGLTADSFDEAVNDTLLAYGVSDIANANDIPKLRALAKVSAYEAAVAAANGRTDWDEAGASFKQSQYRTAARLGLADAKAAAAVYGEDPLAGNVITVGQITTYDPYASYDPYTRTEEDTRS